MVDAHSSQEPPGSSASDHEVLERYRQLRVVARRLLSAERANHTLQPTDLLHEALARLPVENVEELDQDGYRKLVATAMRHVLIDHARARACHKRGARARRIDLDALELASTGSFDEIVAIDEAIEHLAVHDEALAQLVRLRFFGGLTVDETAVALGTSARSVNRDWALARALLFRMLQPEA